MSWIATLSVSVLAICLSLLFYAFLGYPLLTFVLAGICKRKVKKSPIEPTVTFIISAYNEEEVIEAKIKNTFELDYPKDKLDILVASDGSTDATDEIVKRFSDQGVRLLRTEGRLGKTLTLDEAIADARGEIVVCSDATSIYEKDSVRELVANFADPTIGGVSGRVAYKYNDSAVAKGFRIYQKFVIRQRMNESQFGHMVLLSGAIHAIRRDVFVPCPAAFSTEEWNAFQTAKQGLRAIYEPKATCWEQSRSQVSSEFKARVRMAVRCYGFTLYAMRHGFTRNILLYTFQNVSGKIIRWLMPLILLGCLLSGTVAALTLPSFWPLAVLIWAVMGVAILSVKFPKLSAAIPGLSLLSFLTLVMGAFTVAIVKFVFGAQAATWEPDRIDA